MLSNQHHRASKCSCPIHPAAFGPDGTRTLFCFQNTCTCVCSRLPPPSSVLTVFFRPFFSPPAGELRAADAAGGLEGKNLRERAAVAMRWNLLPPPPYYPSPPLFVVLFSSASRLSRSGCLWPPSSVSVVPLGKQRRCLSVSTEEGHLRLREAKNSNNDGTTSLGYPKRKTVMSDVAEGSRCGRRLVEV